jgi:hypothetical protein
MSDFNEVVKRITTDRAFRSDLLKDVNGTLAAHNYTCAPEELSELKRLNDSKLDQLDESLLEQVAGGATMMTTFSSPILYEYPLMQNSINSLYQQNFYSGFTRPGGLSAAGDW